MDTQEQPKKHFCARCFLAIDPDEKIEIDGQSFHRPCSTCCICRTIPSSIKMFYGHVFCSECFKTHVLTRFRGESPRIHSNSWWMQWAPGAKPQTTENAEDKEMRGPQKDTEEQTSKKCICTRCLQAVEPDNQVCVDGQSFHAQCAKCYFCHSVPRTNLKIYYGQVFCEDCFHRFVLNRNKDSPSEFYKSCFEQWQNNGQFADHMREFMASGNDKNTPFVFMMQGGPQSTFCRCGMDNQGVFQGESKKSATPATVSTGEESFSTWDLTFENRTEMSDFPESCAAIDESANQENLVVAAAEKIEKLTKYLQDVHVANENGTKKWKNFDIIECETASSTDTDALASSKCTFVDLQFQKYKSRSNCPKCLWQRGPIYVNSEYLQKVERLNNVRF